MMNRVSLACPRCGEPAQAGDQFCEACGYWLVQADAENIPDRSEIDLGAAAGVTDRGLLHRRNEDALYVAALDGAVVVVVSDGVSTSAAPHLAARAAADKAGQLLGDALSMRGRTTDGEWNPLAATAAAMIGAQEAVLIVPWPRESPLAAPSCTFVSALWDGETVAVGWAGDSRAYWIGVSAWHQLTVDHSWAQEQRDAGTRCSAEVDRDPRAHSITRWLGADAPDQPPQTASFRPLEPGRLVVCSDGLWNYAPTAEALAELIRSHPPEATPIDLARSLVDHAIAAGGRDNVTVAVVDLAPTVGLGVERRNHGELSV